MKRLNKKGLKNQKRPGGYEIRPSFSEISAGGSIPANVVEEHSDVTEDIASDLLKFGNNAANDMYNKRCKDANIKPHPARFPAALPEFFIKLLTDPKDIVLDPFAGSNTTGAVAERLQRFWIASENVEDYLKASKFRFET
jgi:DNA modification methylase